MKIEICKGFLAVMVWNAFQTCSLSLFLFSEFYEVSLIDNVHSDIARLRGFYGQLVVDGRDVLLLEARSGNHTIRWPIKSLKKWFCPKVAAREDRDKIIVIITHK